MRDIWWSYALCGMTHLKYCIACEDSSWLKAAPFFLRHRWKKPQIWHPEYAAEQAKWEKLVNKGKPTVTHKEGQGTSCGPSPHPLQKTHTQINFLFLLNFMALNDVYVQMSAFRKIVKIRGMCLRPFHTTLNFRCIINCNFPILNIHQMLYGMKYT